MVTCISRKKRGRRWWCNLKDAPCDRCDLELRSELNKLHDLRSPKIKKTLPRVKGHIPLVKGGR